MPTSVVVDPYAGQVSCDLQDEEAIAINKLATNTNANFFISLDFCLSQLKDAQIYGLLTWKKDFCASLFD
ncbi:MAG: hypothetical protein Salg2KO_02460 [Salibacteraceae bacterium]